MLRVKQLRSGHWFSYLIYDDVSGQALIVDPIRGLCDLFELLIEDAELSVQAIVETQCHWQRASGAGPLYEIYGAPRCHSAAGRHPAAHLEVADGDVLRLGNERVIVHAAPGVAADAVVLAADGFALTGNTLLVGGSGALGLPGSCPSQLFESMQRIFVGMGDATVLYPAQDCQGLLFSTLGLERARGGEFTVEDHDLFVSRKRRAPWLVLDASLQRIWEANRAQATNWDTDPATGLPCSCLSPDAYLRDEAKPLVPEVHVADAKLRGQAGTPMIDVREHFELLVGEVPGALHMPVSELGERFGQLRATETLVLCAHGNRSAWAANTLSRLGVPTLNVAGGLSAWREAGLEVA